MKSLKKRIAFSLMDSKVLQEVEAVQVIGYMTENNHYINNNARRIAIIPNGFREENIPTFEKSKNLVFGYLGRLECRQKGLDILLPAFVNYKRNGGTGILRVAGSGSDELKLKGIVSDAGMVDSVIFDGALYDDRKWRFLYNCSAFVHPSRWEGLPTACLEAAYAGCPLLITEAVNMGQYLNVRNAGITIKAPNADSICKQLIDFERIYHNKAEYELMRKSAQDMIRLDLNWNVIVKRIVTELYGL